MKEPTKNAIACRKWKEKNRERELERQRSRVYSEDEREYRRAYSRKYHAKNRERLITRSREYYEIHKERLNSMTKEEMLFRNARNRAKKKKVPFTITIEDIIIPDNCPVFPWIKLCLTNDKTEDNSPSLDRVIPELGYVKGNIQIISHRANTIKSHGTAEEHMIVAEYIKRAAPSAQNTNQ